MFIKNLNVQDSFLDTAIRSVEQSINKKFKRIDPLYYIGLAAISPMAVQNLNVYYFAKKFDFDYTVYGYTSKIDIYLVCPNIGYVFIVSRPIVAFDTVTTTPYYDDNRHLENILFGYIDSISDNATIIFYGYKITFE